MANIIIQDVRQERKRELAGKQDTIITFAALMGRGDGVRPDVDGREGYVWVRVGHAQALQMAYNSRVMPRDDLAIYVGYEPEQPNLLQVISVRQESYVNTGQGMIPVVKDHHLTHEWGGGDDVWIAYRRLVDLHLGQPAGFVVTLNPGLVYRSGAYMWIPPQTIDLSGSQPAIGAQARYVLVYLDALGVLSSRDGTIRPNPTALLVSDIPIPLAGEIAIAAVRLYASQTEIGDDPDNRDIVELREFQPYSAAGIHELLSATHDDTTVAACVLGDVITGQAGPLWKRLAISVPAANVRNVFGVDNGETGPSWKTALDANNPTTIGIGDAAAPGTSLIFSHRDHQHASPATWTATAHNLLSATHGDTVVNAVTRGSLIYGNSTPAWDELVIGGAAGSFLTRDATDVLWSGFYLTGTPGNTYDLDVAGGAHDLLSATHTDTVAQAVSRGSLVYGDSTPAWNELVIGGAIGSFLTRDANDVLWSGFYLAGTAGQTYTFPAAGGTIPTGTGTNTYVTYWTGTNSLSGNANLTFDLTRLMAQIADAATNTIVYPIKVSHITSNAAAAGFGCGIDFWGEDDGGTTQQIGILGFAWKAATAGSEVGQFTISLTNAANLEEAVVIVGETTILNVAGNARGVGAVDIQTYRAVAANVASGAHSTIVGGYDNTSNGNSTTVVGGIGNTASGDYSATVGSRSSTSSGESSTIVGGYLNATAGLYAASIGGYQNDVGGDYSVGLGRQSKIAAAHDGTFLFADGTAADFNSVAANEFAIRARGKFRHAYDDSNYWTADVSAAGAVTFDATGASAGFAFSDSVTLASAKFLTALTDGNTGGLRAGSGSDVLLYRGAADTWRTPDTLIVDGSLGVGVTSFTANGGKIEVSNGITFPAAQSACSNVNTLDDYEEGTVTVTMTCSTSGTITLTEHVLAYTKIGRVVHLTGYLTVASVSSPVGNVIINGLPFTCANSNEFYAAGATMVYGLDAGATTSIVSYVIKNTTTMTIYRFGVGALAALAPSVKAGSEFIIGVTYFTTT